MFFFGDISSFFVIVIWFFLFMFLWFVKREVVVSGFRLSCVVGGLWFYFLF